MSDRHDWMAGMTDFQRGEVARLESRIVSFEKRWESLEADWNDCKKALAAAKAELAAAIKQRDEAHSLIRTWKVNLVDVVDDGEIMYAMTSDGRCSMNDAHKRAFLAAKDGGEA